MTVIAWDGKTIAADKQATCSGLKRKVTKLYRVGDAICAFSGEYGNGLDMVEWARDGFIAENFPESQKDKDSWNTFIVLDASGLRVYENSTVALKFEDGIFATGSGRDYALAAMHCGKTSREAVEIACIFDNGCGLGIDEMAL